MLHTMLKVNRHFCDLSPRKPLISKVLSTAKLFLQPARELYLLNNPHSSRKRFLKINSSTYCPWRQQANATSE